MNENSRSLGTMVCYHSRDLVFNPVPEGFLSMHPICAVDTCQFGSFGFLSSLQEIALFQVFSVTIKLKAMAVFQA